MSSVMGVVEVSSCISSKEHLKKPLYEGRN